MIVVPVLIAVTGGLGVVGGFLLQETARTTSASTAPGLIGIQDLFASVAEADAAATAAHLSVSASGVEDRASRNLYLDALRRANEQLTIVAADIGQVVDETDEAAGIRAGLQNIGASLTAYGGSVEAARVANVNDLPTADDQLQEALDVVDREIGPSVAAVTDAARTRYDDEAGRGTTLVGVAIGIGFVTLLVLIWIQYRLAQRVRRVVNVFLALATLAFLGYLGMLANGLVVRQQALSDASDGGYDAITASARMQDATFSLQSQLGFRLLEPGRLDADETVLTLIAEADSSVDAIRLAADSDRELAAAETLAVRWDRYRVVALEVSSLSDRARSDEAVEVFQGEGLSSFNGVNTAIESVLSDNRTQFTDGVAVARSAVERMPWISLALAVLAGVLAFFGFQQRLGDYR